MAAVTFAAIAAPITLILISFLKFWRADDAANTIRSFARGSQATPRLLSSGPRDCTPLLRA